MNKTTVKIVIMALLISFGTGFSTEAHADLLDCLADYNGLPFEDAFFMCLQGNPLAIY